jgi:hypothetical protein
MTMDARNFSANYVAIHVSAIVFGPSFSRGRLRARRSGVYRNAGRRATAEVRIMPQSLASIGVECVFHRELRVGEGFVLPGLPR